MESQYWLSFALLESWGLLAAGDGVLLGTEAEFDDGARVRNQFGLPAVVGLKFLHG